MAKGDGWEFWIDVGGTFTDCIGRDSDGRLHTCKVLSSGVIKAHTETSSREGALICHGLPSLPDDFFVGYTVYGWSKDRGRQGLGMVTGSSGETITVEGTVPTHSAIEFSCGEEAPILGIRRLLGLRCDQPIGKAAVLLGTTRGTNALLERKGAPVAFVTTHGFGDLLEIGTQTRPDLFCLHIDKPPPLYQCVVEVIERIAADGSVITALDEKQTIQALQSVRSEGINALALCLINSYRNASHEKRIAELAREVGFDHISLSSQLSPTLGLLPRAGTTLVNAYLSPIIDSYLATLQSSMPEATMKVMTSAGGLVAPEHYLGKDSLLSGPAGGVVGFVDTARQAGYEHAIGFDMGGTSTDVSRFGGEFEYRFAFEKGGVTIASPMLAIETVAAGGGSICAFDGQRLTVGPESAGASPGPACYGLGGPLTVTDINFYSGKIVDTAFPFPLDRQAVEQRLREIQQAIERELDQTLTLDQLASGFTDIANQKMGDAIRTISSAKGFDPSSHLFVAFGGAGPQHACTLANSLGISRLLIPSLGGILSAYGIGLADIRQFTEEAVLETLSPKLLDTLEPHLIAHEQRLSRLVEMEDAGELQSPIRHFDLRYHGEEATISVVGNCYENLRQRFTELHHQFYGLTHDDREIEVVALRVEVTSRRPRPTLSSPAQVGSSTHPSQPLLHGGTWHTCPVVTRESLLAGHDTDGPLLITEGLSTIVVDPDWNVKMCDDGALLMTRTTTTQQGTANRSTKSDPVRLELFHNNFAYTAERMGQALQKASVSVNVKERLDFSCAVLDSGGHLIANAPHIPVHLGAMGATVKALIKQVSSFAEGDVYLCNDPALGGSHLPDLTVMTPVIIGGELRFFTASRAHHAEIGGVSPGSFYPFAHNLAEEGVIFRNEKIASAGVFDEAKVRQLLQHAPYPSRNPDENIADIRAAIAANYLGEQELLRLVEEHTWDVIDAYMGHIRHASAQKVRHALEQYPDGTYTFKDTMDDGSVIAAKLTVEGGSLAIDFTGSAPVNPTSLNANPAVVQSAVIYCMRCLIDEEVPLNEGMLDPVSIQVPEGMLNPPYHPDTAKRAAVVAGNVEISQRIVDVIFGALSRVAASQGTMNNVVFGDDTFGYYETIGGGTGANSRWPGASGVHSHMTNTRITDAEVLEHRYPIRLHRFGLRHASGGSGTNSGGDGIIREFEFLRPLQLCLLTQRRTTHPFGLSGGLPGSSGQNILQRHHESDAQLLPAMIQTEVDIGDTLTIMTPGGGGYGPPFSGGR